MHCFIKRVVCSLHSQVWKVHSLPTQGLKEKQIPLATATERPKEQ